MKNPTRLLSVFAATCLAFASYATAQLSTYSTETLSSWVGNTVNFQPTVTEGTLGQTFTGVAQINSLTFAFVSSLALPTTGNLTYSFGEWNSGSSSFVGTPLLNNIAMTVNSANFTTPLAGRFVNLTDGVFGTGGGALADLSGFTLDVTKTYALLFTSSADQNFGLGWLSSIGGNAFPYGKSFDSAGAFGPNVDYAFSVISVEVPSTPESSTVAAILGAVLVAGLVGFRLRQQRQQAVAPVLAA